MSASPASAANASHRQTNRPTSPWLAEGEQEWQRDARAVSRVTPPSSRVRRHIGRRSPTELGLSVAIAAGTALLLRLWGSDLSHSRRERLLLLRPELGLRDAAAVAIAVFALSVVSAGARRWLGPVSAPLAAVQRSLTGVTRVPVVVGLTAIVSVAAAVRVL